MSASDVVGDELAIEQLADDTHLGGEFGGVRDDDQRHLVVAIQLHQQIRQRPGIGVVKRAGRLIGEDKAGLIDQRAHDGDPLAFAAGELRRAVGEPVPEADTLEQLFCTLDRLGRCLTVFGERWHEDVF